MKPMLAVDASDEINFPVFASPKIDGIRCLIRNDIAMSRSFKPIPNIHIQDRLGNSMLNGLDGELTVGLVNGKNVMQATTSGVMSTSGFPRFSFWIFDTWLYPEMPYKERLKLLHKINLGPFPEIMVLPQVVLNNSSELHSYEEKILEQGFEGVMLRKIDGPYKFGRSTLKEGYLLKVKRFKDSEAIIIGAEELFHNDNEEEKDELGYTKRSLKQSGMVPANTLGSLNVIDVKTGVEFNIGTGYNAQQRKTLWEEHLEGKLKGRIITYRYFDIGIKRAPRFPVFISFREDL